MIEKIREHKKTVKEMWRLGIVVSVSGKVQVLYEDVFHDIVKDYEIKERECDSYPFEKTGIVDGIRFVYLMSEEEYEKSRR